MVVMNTQHRNVPETLPLFPHDAGMETGIDVSGPADRGADRGADQKAGLRADRWAGTNLDGPDGPDGPSGRNRQTDARSPVGQRFQPRKRHTRAGRGRRDINPHLLAARKLSKKIKYLPDHSEAQTQTAHAICQHLRLLLATAESAD